jgi:hypothetical protein
LNRLSELKWAPSARGALGELIPLFDGDFDVGMHIGLELADGPRRKGVRDSLALARVVGAMASGENAGADADKGVVKRRFQTAIAVSAYSVDSLVIVDTNVVRLDAHDGAELAVNFVDDGISVPPAAAGS